MKTIGFIQNMFDRSLFRREATKTEQKIECVIWTDDFLASVKSEADAAWLKRKVEDRWAPGGKSVKFEHATFFLGANIEQCDTHTLKYHHNKLTLTTGYKICVMMERSQENCLYMLHHYQQDMKLIAMIVQENQQLGQNLEHL